MSKLPGVDNNNKEHSFCIGDSFTENNFVINDSDETDNDNKQSELELVNQRLIFEGLRDDTDSDSEKESKLDAGNEKLLLQISFTAPKDKEKKSEDE